jgi:SH3-like domain-containing protein
LSKHNYSQYSDKKKTNNTQSKSNKAVTSTIPKSSSPEVKIEVELVQETVNTVTLPKTVSGVVVNCAKLNVREEPSADADVVCVLDVMSEIKIDAAKSDNEWFKICTASGIEGYCMRKFVDARL